MNVWFSSDFHFGHNVIAPKYRNYPSPKEHDEALLQQLSTFDKRNLLFILGDFLFDCDNYEWYLTQISKMSLRIKLLLGNHDSLRLYDASTRPSNIEIQRPLFSYKNMWLSHCPIHPQEMRRRVLNVHGHLHNDIVEDDLRYFNVCLDQHNFNFVPLEIIKQRYKEVEKITTCLS